MRNLILLLLLTSFDVLAQKLPNKQDNSVWLPAAIKIDGKAAEWQNQFQAFNHATELYYTVANDAENLYFLFRCENQTVIKDKIMTGGITLVLNAPHGNQTITYPFFPRKEIPTFKQVSLKEMNASGAIPDKYKDSISKINNVKFASAAKEILTRGFKGLDSLISVYNERGIKISGSFDKEQMYTYELMLPIKALNGNLNEGIRYQILVNGPLNKYDAAKVTLPAGRNPDGTPASRAQLDQAEIDINTAMAARYATIEFSGQYILAKKP